MRKTLLLLLTLTFTWFGAKSNTFVASANTVDPIVGQAYKSVFSSLNASTAFGQFVRGMIMADNAPGCPTDIIVNQLSNAMSCTADQTMWTEPTPEANVTTPTDTLFINVITGDTAFGLDLSSAQLLNLSVGEYRVEYHYDVATETSSTKGVCNVLLNVIDNMKPSIDINNTTVDINDTLTVTTTDTTCATGTNSVDISKVFRPLVSDSCDNSSLVSFEVTNASGTVIASDDTLTTVEGNLLGSIKEGLIFTLGFNHINFTAYDLNGNMSTKSIVVEVTDAQDPIFGDTIAISNTAITTDSLSTDIGSDSKAISYLIPGAEDNCNVSYSFIIISGGDSITGTGNNINADLMIGEHTVKYTATDASGNFQTLSHTVVVSDNEAPTVVCPNDEFTGPFYTSITCEYDFSTESVAGKDNFSNNLKNYWEILDVDTLPFGTPKNGDAVNTFDNISATLSAPGRYAVRQWVTDEDKTFGDAGYSSDTCIAFFSVLDTIVPVLDSKPEDISINITSNCDTIFAPGVPSATENCGLNNALSSYIITNNINGDTLYAGTSAAGDLPFRATIDSTNNVIYTYSFYFEDKSSNSVSYAYNIFVNDTIVPTITTTIFSGLSETTVYTNASSCNVAFTLPTSFLDVDDNCGIASVKMGNTEIYNPSAQSTNNIDVVLNDTLNVYYFTIVDLSGNSATDSIIVNKVDTIKPVLNGGTAYANINEYNSASSCDYVYSINRLSNLLQASDNCGIDSVIIAIDLDILTPGGNTIIRLSEAELLNPFSFNFPASQLNDGNSSQTHLVSIRAKDISNNSSDISSFTVVVSDKIKPQIFLEDSVVYYVNGNDCNSVTIDSSDTRASIFINQLGTVNDNCASDRTLLANMVNDNPASAIAGDSLFGNFPLGTTKVTFTTDDGNSNVFSQSIKVIVIDTIAPNSVINVVNTTTNDSTCTATLTINSPVTISDDNCGVDSVEYSLDGGVTYIGLDSLNASFENTFALDTTTVFWRSYDNAGNSVEFATLVIIRDTFNPTLTLDNADLNFFASATDCAKSITLPTVVVNENCGIDSVVSVFRTVQGAFDTSVTFVNTPVIADLLAVHFADTVTYTLTTIAYDVNGNVSNMLTNFITYSDTILPVINATDTIYLKTDTLLCTTTVELDSLGKAYGLNVSDNCGINNVLYNVLNSSNEFTDTSFSATEGTYDFEVNVLDNSKNFAKRSFTIVVESSFEDKILSAPSDTIFTNVFANECSKNVAFDSLVVNTCGINYAIVSSVASGSLFGIGNTNVAWYVIDQGDTLFTYNFVVSVIDNQDPVIKQAPQNITLYIGSDCTVQYNYVLDVQDNCDAQGLTVTSSVPSGSNLTVGTFTNTYTVADESGNTISGSNTVTVLDSISPSFSEFPVNIISCNPVITYEVDGTDNCSGVFTSLENGKASGETFDLGTTTVTHTVTDASGNSVTQSFIVEVLPQATNSDAGSGDTTNVTNASFALAGNSLDSSETGTWSVTPALASISDVNNPTTEVTFTIIGEYTFTWTVDNGQCTPNSSNVTVLVTEDSEAFREDIVAGFTPNGDGVNDAWTLPGIEDFPTATVKIFNRWGSVIFETSTPATEAWDGTNEGTELPVASYYYVIDLGDGSKKISGIVSIIK